MHFYRLATQQLRKGKHRETCKLTHTQSPQVWASEPPSLRVNSAKYCTTVLLKIIGFLETKKDNTEHSGFTNVNPLFQNPSTSCTLMQSDIRQKSKQCRRTLKYRFHIEENIKETMQGPTGKLSSCNRKKTAHTPTLQCLGACKHRKTHPPTR